MRAVVQRVTQAKVTVEGRVTGEIGPGLLVLLGAGAGDTEADLTYIVDKLVNLRIFADPAGKMNLSVLDLKGGVLVVSQFTLYGMRARVGGRRSSGRSSRPPRGRSTSSRWSRSGPRVSSTWPPASSGPTWRCRWSTMAR
jgi:D-tyrosyl-tRNA(Tyr) deacylase